MKTTKLSRRGLLGAASATAATAILGQPGKAATAEFDFKLGVNTPETHPLTIRLNEAAKAIGAQSSGRLNVTVFSKASSVAIPRCSHKSVPAASTCWRCRA